MPKIDIDAAPIRSGTGYPPPYDEPCRERWSVKLGDAAGISQFGVNLLHLPPGQWSSQRHWHTSEDEFVWVLEGEVVLVDDAGETVLRAGDCAGFPMNDGNGHHLQNRTGADARVLVVGSRNPVGYVVHYPDIDLHLPDADSGYTRKDGRGY